MCKLYFSIFRRTMIQICGKYGHDGVSQVKFDKDLWIKAVGKPKKGKLYGFRRKVNPNILLRSRTSLYSNTW